MVDEQTESTAIPWFGENLGFAAHPIFEVVSKIEDFKRIGDYGISSFC